MKRIIQSAALALAMLVPGAAHAAGDAPEIEDIDFGFEGVFGTFDQHAVQRGFQVYQTVCSGCHGLKFVSFHELEDPDGPAFSVEQVKAIAAEFYVPDDDPEAAPGDERTAIRADHFPSNTTAGAPDLSLMAKARPGGADYLYALMTGYTGEQNEDGLYKNTAFPGGYISMAPPLDDEAVEYQDGTEATLERHALDVSEFLAWASEPEQIQRKRAGVRTIGFLIILTVMLYFVNRKLWKPVKHPEAH